MQDIQYNPLNDNCHMTTRLFHESSFNDNIEIIRKIITEKQFTSDELGIALVNSVSTNKFEISKLLIEKGANIHFNRNLAFWMACRKGNLQLIELLYNNGCSVCDPFSSDALSIACKEGHLDVVKFFIKNGSNINSFYYCPLSAAINGNKWDIVNFLLDSGADIKLLPDDQKDILSKYMKKHSSDTELSSEKLKRRRLD